MTKASELAIGDVVTLGKVYEDPITWQIIGKDHSGYPSNSVTLLSKYILAVHAYDAKETSTSNNNYQEYGNGNWSISNIRQWLNSSADEGSWYTPQHQYDQPPSIYRVQGNPYDQEAGFLNEWESNEIASLLTTSLTTYGVGNYATTTNDKVFLLAAKEIVGSDWAMYDYGIKFAEAFQSMSSRIAYPTQKCVSRNTYSMGSSFSSSKPWNYLTRTKNTTTDYFVGCINSDGGTFGDTAFNGARGIRPACNIDGDTEFALQSDGTYAPVFNNAPLAPLSITISPNPILRNRAFQVTWGPATDYDGTIEKYILERDKGDGDGFVPVYQGPQRTFTDKFANMIEQVTYRVKAVDDQGAESPYISATATMALNAGPSIQMNDNYGMSVKPINIAFLINDPDDDILDVTLTMNGETVYEDTEYPANTNYTYTPDWDNIGDGDYELELTVTDTQGASASATTKFQKYTAQHMDLEETVVTSHGLETSFRRYNSIKTGVSYASDEQVDQLVEDLFTDPEEL